MRICRITGDLSSIETDGPISVDVTLAKGYGQVAQLLSSREWSPATQISAADFVWLPTTFSKRVG